MSSLDRLAAIGDICGSLRSPPRNMNSAVEMNCAGWPEIEGTAGFEEFPPGPWQATQTWAFSPPASGSAAPANPARNKDAAANIAELILPFTVSKIYSL